MDRNRKTPQGRVMGPLQEERNVRAEHSQQQYNHTTRNPKQSPTDKQFQRILIDMWCSFSGGLLQPKFSYYVGSDGRLTTRAERRGGK